MIVFSRDSYIRTIRNTSSPLVQGVCLNFIFFCFGVRQCMIMSLKQKNIKFKPRIKLNHNRDTTTAEKSVHH